MQRLLRFHQKAPVRPSSLEQGSGLSGIWCQRLFAYHIQAMRKKLLDNRDVGIAGGANINHINKGIQEQFLDPLDAFCAPQALQAASALLLCRLQKP